MEVLDTSLPSIESVTARIPSNEKIVNLEVSRFLKQTIFRIRTDKQEYLLPADSMEKLPNITSKRINQIAHCWNSAPVARVDTLHKLDQWIPFGQLKKELPIIKFYFSDKEKHELYISSHSGEVLQYTTVKERFWSWLGAIPHWIYFTSLRQNRELWIKSVVILSAIGVVMTLAGLYVGIHAFVQRRKNKRIFGSPYKKKWYWLHHITGLIFGILVLTWIFSGMMSLVDTPKWIAKDKQHYPIHQVLEGNEINPGQYPLDYRFDMQRAYLLIDWQGTNPAEKREYQLADDCYESAVQKYRQAQANGTEDAQMTVLKNLIDQLYTSGWLK